MTSAAAGATATTDSTRARTTWNIDTAHTDVGFSVRHMMIAKVRGSFPGVTGRIEIDSEDLTRSQVDVTIDAASVTTRNEQRDEHLRSDDFFAVEQFPELTFRSTAIEQMKDGRLAVTGDLTIRGVTREIVLDAKQDGHGVDPWGQSRLGFTASATIDRHDYGLTWNQALEAGGMLVAREVTITIDGQAIMG
jgi:polyisoprenoid-binding protein YceI